MAVFLNNAVNPDLKFEKFLKFMVFKEPPFLISRSKFLFFSQNMVDGHSF